MKGWISAIILSTLVSCIEFSTYIYIYIYIYIVTYLKSREKDVSHRAPMDFDPDSMIFVGARREFMSLRDCQQIWLLTLLPDACRFTNLQARPHYGNNQWYINSRFTSWGGLFVGSPPVYKSSWRCRDLTLRYLKLYRYNTGNRVITFKIFIHSLFPIPETDVKVNFRNGLQYLLLFSFYLLNQVKTVPSEWSFNFTE